MIKRHGENRRAHGQLCLTRTDGSSASLYGPEQSGSWRLILDHDFRFAAAVAAGFVHLEENCR